MVNKEGRCNFFSVTICFVCKLSSDALYMGYLHWSWRQCTFIHTFSDLGDLSNLIGSLSRTFQQYSPPTEWIMCKLVVFPIFLPNDKVEKILGLTHVFLRQEKTATDSKRRFSIYYS